MIRTKTFHTVASVASYFNREERVNLRLVSVLPPTGRDTELVAVYDEPGPGTSKVEAERRRILHDRISSLWGMSPDKKVGHNFPRSILDADLVPFSIVSNRLRTMAVFKDLDAPRRADWIRANLEAVQCAYVPTMEARENYGCAAELIRIEA